MRSVPDPPDSLPPELAELLRELPPELTPEEKREVLRELSPDSPEPRPTRKPEEGWSGEGLYLPSFGIRIQRNDPQKIVHHQGDFRAGDAVSRITLPPRALEDPSKLRTWQDFVPDPVGDMRGLLLAILEIEEYTGAYIRLSDLRLASVLQSWVLQPGLKPVLEQLERPITAKRVVDWKLHLLEAVSQIPE